MAEKLFRSAHDSRSASARKRFQIDPALPTSMGLLPENYARLLRDAGFRQTPPRPLPEGAFGPQAPVLWDWRPPRKDAPRQERQNRSRKGHKSTKPSHKQAKGAAKRTEQSPAAGNAFSQLADLIKS